MAQQSSSEKKRTSKSSHKRDNTPIFAGLATICLLCITAGGILAYKNSKEKPPENNNTQQIQDILKSDPLEEIDLNPTHPKVVIPQTTGNVKDLVTILAQKSGFAVDWKLKGHYSLTADEIRNFNNPISLVLTPLTDMMTLNNKELTVKWRLGNGKEPFPYPIYVTTLVCGKTIMLFELAEPKQVDILLKRPDFGHCVQPMNGVLSAVDFIDYSQFDFTKAPPFLKPFDPKDAQNTIIPKADTNTEITTPQINTSSKNNSISQPNWVIPADMQPIEVKPQILNTPPPPELLRGASSQ